MEFKLGDIEDLIKKQPTLELQPTTLSQANIRPTKVQQVEKAKWKRNLKVNRTKGELDRNFADTKRTTLSEKEAILEAARCLKCADAPCQKGCPTSIDIKSFISAIANRNFYGAAKIIFSDNPVGMSCGMLCTTTELCTGNCNLALEHGGAIDISGLQEFATQRFREINVAQTHDPDINPEMLANPKAKGQKIALIGCGPASISCATFLARMGYTDVNVFERQGFGGGVAAAEVPEFRIPQTAINYEVDLMKDLGVKVHYGKELGVGRGKITLESLKSDGFEAVFLGIGRTEPLSDKPIDGLEKVPNFMDAKEFLLAVMTAARDLPNLLLEEKKEAKQQKTADAPYKDLPKLHGKVVVLGAGDVAMDCARSAFRCGADRVAIVLRRNTTEVRATDSEATLARDENVEFMPYCTIKEVHQKDGKITHCTFWKTEKDANGKYVKDDDQIVKIRCDFVVSAFGATAPKWLKDAIPCGVNDWNKIDVNEHGQTSTPWLFAGGDIIGNNMNVEAANDGKTAAWGIHNFFHKKFGTAPKIQPSLPVFHTDIDKVDISVEMCGIKFPNPYGLASAPPATSIHMIRRAFHMGWGYAVTKTFSDDYGEIVNVSPRIFSSVQGRQEWQTQRNGWMNIELISEKSHHYWLRGIKELKREFPDRIVIASIMSCHNKEKWELLAKACCEAGADAIEMNLSCPHGMHEKGMGLALGTYPNVVEEVVSWVKKASTIPVFAKLTPNVTDIADIAGAARRGGADGVTAINTISGLVGFHQDGTPFRFGVGGKAAGAYGGLSGNSVRPVALRAIHHLSDKLPDFPIMATGGVDNADTTLQFLYAGASVVQICSAVMNQDLTIIQDLVTGLKTLLYMRGRKDLKSWDSQTPPQVRVSATPVDDPMRTVLKPAKKFGKYELERRAQVKTRENTVEKKISYERMPAPPPMGKIPTLNELIGFGVKRVETNHMELSRPFQKVATIHDDLCLNCGKCVMTCNDNGYQAISFDVASHIPHVNEDDCTGCGICESVCPAMGCIEFIPRKDKEGNHLFLPPFRGETAEQKHPHPEIVKIAP